ncbi:unnamed protein product [Rangifer tarandus platyrhynchus]|uniref:Uncharacterized protein n=1 Tax=Rangifer tarandus platyrhynchus TaxID=3082113 RepID=A0ABN8ZE95_RANTA|nr:unnamed protein product [Rangifer tarandus platyrhynchus]
MRSPAEKVTPEDSLAMPTASVALIQSALPTGQRCPRDAQERSLCSTGIRQGAGPRGSQSLCAISGGRVRPGRAGQAGGPIDRGVRRFPSASARLPPPGAPVPTCSVLRPEPGSSSSSGRSERSPAPHPPAAPSPP